MASVIDSVASVDMTAPESPESVATNSSAEERDNPKVVSAEKKPQESPNATKSPKAPAKGKKSTSVPYTQVIHNAIVALKDRTGSSQPAIQKWILTNHPEMDAAKLKQKMLFTLKLGVKSKRFVKIKSSFKVNPVWLKAEKKKKTTETVYTYQ